MSEARVTLSEPHDPVQWTVTRHRKHSELVGYSLKNQSFDIFGGTPEAMKPSNIQSACASILVFVYRGILEFFAVASQFVLQRITSLSRWERFANLENQEPQQFFSG